MAIGTDVKAPYYILGADGNYHRVLNENIAEQIEGVGRRPATAYEAGDVVASSTNNKVLLLCTKAGTTAETDLNIANKTVGEAITDGTVGWKLIQRYTEVLPIAGGGTGQTTVAGVRNILGLGNTDGALPIANGGTGADNANTALSNLGILGAIVNASVSGKTITFTKKDNTRFSINTQDTDNGIVAALLKQNGYVKFANGLIMQWGVDKKPNNGESFTFPVSFTTVYACWIQDHWSAHVNSYTPEILALSNSSVRFFHRGDVANYIFAVGI